MEYLTVSLAKVLSGIVTLLSNIQMKTLAELDQLCNSLSEILWSLPQYFPLLLFGPCETTRFGHIFQATRL